MDFEVPSGPFEEGVVGCSWTRHRQRLYEIEQSLNIVQQAIAKMPDGGFAHPKVTRAWKAPAGEAYVATESPRGELGFYIISDGGKTPYRIKTRGPSFSNISLLGECSRGLLIGDLIALIGSTDITLGEVDR